MTVNPLVLVVCENDDRRGRFEVDLDRRYLLSSSGAPFVDACRVLRAHGFDPRSIVVMRHHGSDLDALRGRLGAVAELEISGGGVGFRPARALGTAPLVRFGPPVGITPVPVTRCSAPAPPSPDVAWVTGLK
jgi:hypothetical protein